MLQVVYKRNVPDKFNINILLAHSPTAYLILPACHTRACTCNTYLTVLMFLYNPEIFSSITEACSNQELNSDYLATEIRDFSGHNKLLPAIHN